jgi:hypothetical protein
MGSLRTLKRRQQRKAHKAKIAEWRAKWAAMSPAEQKEFKRTRKERIKTLEQANRIAMEIMRPRLLEMFEKESAFVRYLRR